MAVKPNKQANKINPKFINRRVLPPIEYIVSEADKIEDLSREILHCKLGIKDCPEFPLDRYTKIKNLNSFGKQIVIQMMRSNPEFQGYKVDIKDHILKASTLLLAGTLCRDFDHMHTSPLYGCTLLQIGCGALAPYAPSKEDDDLLIKFYNDHPPVEAEILQILGAQVTGVDPRENHKDRYQYQVSYKHKTVEFVELNNCLTTLEGKFDVLTCFDIFNKPSFLYQHDSLKQVSRFLHGFRKVISPQGLLYSSAPVLPTTQENRQMNYTVFNEAGFKVLYEGYYFILEPMF